MWDNLFSSTDLLEQGLNAVWLRGEVIMNNIANADTPGFKVSEVEFEDIMAAALDADGSLEMNVTNGRHISGAAGFSDAEALVTQENSTSTGLDENNVDIETEMVALAKNTIEYYTLVNKINSEFSKLDTAINVS